MALQGIVFLLKKKMAMVFPLKGPYHVCALIFKKILLTLTYIHEANNLKRKEIWQTKNGVEAVYAYTTPKSLLKMIAIYTLL